MTPDGWVPEKMGDITSWRSGGTPPMRNSSFWSGDIPWISASTMHGNAFNTSIKFISEEGLKAGSKLADPNDLLLLVRGSMLWNRIPIGIAKRHLAFNQDVKSITASSSLLPNFLLFWFLANENKLLHMVTGTGIGAGKLDTKELQAIRIEIPPLPEQKKITEILSTWDKAIETVEKLIINSQQKKKALMQQLLTGKKRFPGFDGEWKEVPLKQLCTIAKGKQLNKNTLYKQGLYPVINGGIEPSGYTDKCNCTKDTITISEGGNSCGYVGLIGQDFWCGGHCYTIFPTTIGKRYLYHYLKFNEPKVMRLRVGSGLPNIQKKSIELVKISYPSPEEQQKIASVLSTADREIETWQLELENLKQEKQALMQQLLTGKRRVKVEDD